MDDGFDITFREVMPESGVVELVMHELARIEARAGLHCSVVVRRMANDVPPYGVSVELRASARALAERRAEAHDSDPYFALRRAFATLRAGDAQDGPPGAEYAAP